MAARELKQIIEKDPTTSNNILAYFVILSLTKRKDIIIKTTFTEARG